jgi:hypothetical protein
VDVVMKEVSQIQGFLERCQKQAQNRAMAFGPHTDQIQKYVTHSFSAHSVD